MVYLKLADISVPSLVSLEGGNYDGSVSSPNTVVSPGCGTGAGVAFHCEWTALCTREIALGNMVHRSFRNHLDVRLLCTLWRAVGNFNWLSLEYFFSFFFFIIAFAELWLSDGEDVGAEGWAGWPRFTSWLDFFFFNFLNLVFLSFPASVSALYFLHHINRAAFMFPFLDAGWKCSFS